MSKITTTKNNLHTSLLFSFLTVLVALPLILPLLVSAQPFTIHDPSTSAQSYLPLGSPLAQFPLLHNVISGMPKPSSIRQNQTTTLAVTVNNEENFTLRNVQIFDFGPSDYFKLTNLTKIDVLEPHSTKTIYGNITAARNATGDSQLNQTSLS
jgi:hypothetical protein